MASYSREQFSGTKNRMLLWHGSRLTNWTGILSQGLSFSLLFLNVVKHDVWMGMWDVFVNNNKVPDCVLYLTSISTKGVGATAPDPSEAQTVDDGVIVLLGNPNKQKREGALWYNEYIVYNVDQIRMPYLVQVNFKYTK
ncbi:hypothetical protein CRYUN_Cryun20dG0061200 [Craigia yunnanensis]